MSEAKHDAEPRAQRIERPTADDGMAATSHSTACCGLCALRSGTAPRARKQRAETVFYDSSTARRSLLGALHYCVACPGWAMATSERVVYSRWDMYALSELPAQCCANLCCEREGDWTPPPDPTTFKSPDGAKRGDDDACCACKVPCGRTLDHFDADIIVDASAHQTLCQICRGEGDVVLYRKAGGDLSDPDELFVMTDVVRPFDVFNRMTFELSKINLKDAAAQGVGARMGATVRDHDARVFPAPPFRAATEVVFYDSLAARRTVLGALHNADCCCPPIYKLTSERVLYTEWDYWHLLDEPSCCCAYAARGCTRECCCAIGAADAAVERAKARARAVAVERERGALGRCCAVPVGRTAHFFDLDIVVDVRAHQGCWQLCLNEGSMQFGRLQGGDASHDAKTHQFFNMHNVPEVFAYFDDFSYELSQLDLSNYRGNAMRNDIVAGARL